METVPKYKNKNERQQAFKHIMHRLDIECFGIKYKKSKSSSRRMGKCKHKEVKELYELQEGIIAEKAVAMKVKTEE